MSPADYHEGSNTYLYMRLIRKDNPVNLCF